MAAQEFTPIDSTIGPASMPHQAHPMAASEWHPWALLGLVVILLLVLEGHRLVQWWIRRQDRARVKKAAELIARSEWMAQEIDEQVKQLQKLDKGQP